MSDLKWIGIVRIAVSAVVSIFALLFPFDAFAQSLEAPLYPRPVWKTLPGPKMVRDRILAQQNQTPKPISPIPDKTVCPPDCNRLIAKIKRRGPQMIVINLKRTELPNFVYAPKADRARVIDAYRKAVTARQNRVIDRLIARGIKLTNISRSKESPSIGIKADATTLKALMTDPEVESIGENTPMHLMLNQSIPNGYVVAGLDAGVDANHSIPHRQGSY